MTDTLFKEVHYSRGGLIGGIGLGRIGLTDIQRPFVWANAKVRDLFDSMYFGYPVGYFLFWQTGAEGVETKVRRPLIADVIRQGYLKLAGTAA